MAASQNDPRLPHTDNPATLSQPGGHYSHVAVANGFVFVSGQLPITAQGDKLADASFEVQAEQVLANVQAALESAGSSVAQLVQVRVYIVDVEHWMSFNQIYAHWAGVARPARAVVPVPQLHYGFKIEVEATALV
jgi:reactive intermediate/imine deaminase